jgi:hypothetical protein
VCCTAPVPVADSARDESEALLENKILADVLPLTCGANVSVKGTLCPAAIVTGNVMPLNANSELLELAEETVTLEPLALSAPV